MKERKIKLTVSNISTKQWSSLILELNIMTYPNLETYYSMMRERIYLLEKSNLDGDWDTIYRATSK